MIWPPNFGIKPKRISKDVAVLWSGYRDQPRDPSQDLGNPETRRPSKYKVGTSKQQESIHTRDLSTPHTSSLGGVFHQNVENFSYLSILYHGSPISPLEVVGVVHL